MRPRIGRWIGPLALAAALRPPSRGARERGLRLEPRRQLDLVVLRERGWLANADQLRGELRHGIGPRGGCGEPERAVSLHRKRGGARSRRSRSTPTAPSPRSPARGRAVARGRALRVGGEPERAVSLCLKRHSGGGTVSPFAINADGSLTPIACTPPNCNAGTQTRRRRGEPERAVPLRHQFWLEGLAALRSTPTVRSPRSPARRRAVKRQRTQSRWR